MVTLISNDENRLTRFCFCAESCFRFMNNCVILEQGAGKTVVFANIDTEEFAGMRILLENMIGNNLISCVFESNIINYRLVDYIVELLNIQTRLNTGELLLEYLQKCLTEEYSADVKKTIDEIIEQFYQSEK